MNKHRYILIALLGASLLLSLLYIPYYNPLSGDKEIYRYVGYLMTRGGVPYRDVFDHKPPLIYFLNAAGLWLGDWGQWVIDTLLAGFATFLLYRLGKRSRLTFPWLPPLLFNLMLRDHLLCLGIGMTREYTAMLLVFFFCVLMGRHRFRYFGLGALCALIFFMQQEQVLCLLPFFFYAFLPGKDTLPVAGRMLRVFTGFCSITLPLLLYFTWNHALAAFWQDAFLFNTGWYTTTFKESFANHLIKLKTLLDYGNYEVPFLVTVTLGVSALIFPSTDRKLLLLALVAVPLSICTEFMGGRDMVPQMYSNSFSHYILPLSASIPILLFCVFAVTREPVLSGPRAVGIFGFLLCASLGYTALQHGTHLLPTKEDAAITSPELRYLRQERPGDYQFYVFGNDDYTYFYPALKIIAPSPWVYQHFWMMYDRWDPGQEQMHAIKADLERHRTRYILDFTAKPNWFMDTTARNEWRGFLEANYQPVMNNKVTLCTMWKRKD